MFPLLYTIFWDIKVYELHSFYSNYICCGNIIGIIYSLVYFPIQKLAKIFPNISSFVTSPVISPIKSIHFLMSIDNKSVEILLSIPISDAKLYIYTREYNTEYTEQWRQQLICLVN